MIRWCSVATQYHNKLLNQRKLTLSYILHLHPKPASITCLVCLFKISKAATTCETECSLSQKEKNKYMIYFDTATSQHHQHHHHQSVKVFT